MASSAVVSVFELLYLFMSAMRLSYSLLHSWMYASVPLMSYMVRRSRSTSSLIWVQFFPCCLSSIIFIRRGSVFVRGGSGSSRGVFWGSMYI